MKHNYKKEVFVAITILLLTFSFAAFPRAPVKASESLIVKPEADRVTVENPLVQIVISTKGVRPINWTTATGLQLAADVGSAGGMGKRYPLWDWIPNQDWPGEICLGTFSYKIVEQNDTLATIRFNYTCSQSPIAGLQVVKILTFYVDKYYFDMKVVLINPTGQGISTAAPWDPNIGYNINVVEYAEPIAELYQAYQDGGTPYLDLNMAWNRIPASNITWAAVYSSATGEIVAIAVYNATNTVWFERSGWGAESRVEFPTVTINPSSQVGYVLKVYGGPPDSPQLSEVGMEALATQWCYLTDVTGYEDTGNAIVFNCTPSNGSLTPIVKITFASPSVFRLQMSPDGSVPKGTGEALYSLNETTDFITLTTNNLTVKIRKSPWRLSVYDVTGTALICEETPNNSSDERSLSYLASDTTVHKVSESMFMDPDEHFYGFGERFNALDKRGLSSMMQVMDPFGSTGDNTYLPIPFFISTKGYGLYLNSTYKSLFQMGLSGEDKYSIKVPTSSLDLYFIYGLGDLKEIIKSYTNLTGRAPLPAKWVFYPWMSKAPYNNQAEVMNIVSTTRALDIPAGAIVIENIGEDGFGRSWDPGRFPNPKEMIDYCHSQGVKVIIWEVPIVSPDDPDYSVGESNGYFVKNADGSVYLIPGGYWFSGCAVVDFTNPAAVSWWTGLHQFLMDDGIDGFKTDGGEHIHDDTVVFYDGSRGAEMENKYAQLWNKVMFEYVMNQTGGEGIIWGRSGSAGSQKYPCIWAGDQFNTFQYLQCVIRAGQSAGISGIPFWASDIGGFAGKPSKRLYIRWAQFGAFSPLMQYHGVNYHDPWTFDQETQDIYKFYATLRMNLMPYIYSYAKIASDTGLPIMRALILNYPDDPNVYGIEYEYFFGDELLVAPIYEDTTSRSIYLPEGIWIDFWNDARITGPITVSNYPAPLNKLPLFIKAGAIIPMSLNENYTIGGSITNFSQLVFNIYPYNSTSRFSYYDDENNATRLIESCKEGNQVYIQVSPWNKNYTMRIYVDALPAFVNQDGENLTQYIDFENFKNCSQGWWYDDSSQRVLIRLQQKGAPTKLTVNVVQVHFTLTNLYTVNLYVNGTFTYGNNLTARLYSYSGAYQAESTIWDKIPAHIVLSMNMTHPLGLPMEIVELALLDDGEEIILVARFVVSRFVLASRLAELCNLWAIPSADRRVLFREMIAIDGQWPYAPP